MAGRREENAVFETPCGQVGGRDRGASEDPPFTNTTVHYRSHLGFCANLPSAAVGNNDRIMKYCCGNDEGYDTTRTMVRVNGLPASFLTYGYDLYVYADWYVGQPDGNTNRVYLGASDLDAAHPNAAFTTSATRSFPDWTDWFSTGNKTFTEAVGGATGNYVIFAGL
jgi:hypothetical protein